MAHQHKLFRDFPITGSTELSTGSAPTPYLVYDGHGLLITGIADLNAVQQRTKDEDVYPVATENGHAAMGIFVCDFQEASHGPHLELQVCALVSETPNQIMSDDPFAMVAAMIAHPDWGTLCLHLWNDTANVVAYNTEYLGLNASVAHGQIARGGGRKIFEFEDEDTGPILRGSVREHSWSRVGALIQFTRCAGLLPTIRANARPYFQSAVINKTGSVFQDNRRAQTFTAPDKTVLQYFSATDDDLQIESTDLKAYGFQPLCLEHFTPFRFAYLHPDQSG